MKSGVLFIALGAFTSTASIAAQERTEHQKKAYDIYEKVISIRTARGHQQVPTMVNYLVSELRDAGFGDDAIEVTDYDSDGEPTQGLIVRYAAEGESVAKPIVLLAHMDVVDALPEDWELNPFELTGKDGYFFGRGTTDNKYGVTNLTATFIRLKQEGFAPRRDVYLVFSGDEETGMISTRAQADYVAQKIDPDLVLNSDAGGGLLAPDGTPLYYAVQGAEKTFATFELTVTNEGGHSSRPRADNAIYDLADALKKIEVFEFPVRHSELTRTYFEAAGKVTPGELGAAMRAFAVDPTDKMAIKALRSNPAAVGTTGTTCVATMLRAGHAENALPQSATATVNCRIFPGVGAAATEAMLRKVVDNEQIEFTLMTNVTESPESKLRPDVLSAIEASLAAAGIDAPVVPYMESGGTDGMHYRTKGYDTVAISGAWSKSSDMYAHGLNERLAVNSFYDGLDHWYVILKQLAGPPVSQ
ncbi:MAG: M20/M25/M40 family metallo-hydrolase [Alphaproteobacteria bacterium]|nr:M20/M25/M40 family metallo-hydrolase [Alphaproteobacteria bacterium]